MAISGDRVRYLPAERFIQILKGHDGFKAWLLFLSRLGIATSGVDGDELRISRLFGLVRKELPTAEARYSDWTASKTQGTT
jgi:hypothetical protein